MKRTAWVATIAAALYACVCPAVLRAQTPPALRIRVVDGADGGTLGGVILVLRSASVPTVFRAVTDAGGDFVFTDLARDRYTLSVQRFGYRPMSIDVAIARAEPVRITVRMEPTPFPLDAIAPAGRPMPGTTLQRPAADPPDTRVADVRLRQDRYLAGDVRQIGHLDLREANPLVEDDLLRALQKVPGVAARDDYSAEPWTRGSPASHTVLEFDGIPLAGGLHALGVLSGLNTDMLRTATFQPGVADAALQGGGAAVLSVESRSPATSARSRTLAVSPISVRAVLDGRIGDRVAWAAGARRSYVDAIALPGDLTPGVGRVPYAFADATARLDVAVSPRSRFEISAFWQDDRVSGDVADLARGNEGEWGARVARATFVRTLGTAVLRQTVGFSGFDASLRADTDAAHPATENHQRLYILDGRVESLPGSAAPWSIGIRALHETHAYNGPGIDLARLLTPDELARRGVPELTPIIAGLQRAHMLERERATRLALWAEHRLSPAERLTIDAGLRLETGDVVAGSRIRLAPRVRVRYHVPHSRLSLSAAYGRTWRYTQTVARTDVLRRGLHASEVVVFADGDTPGLRSDTYTLSAEAWTGAGWLLGATGWLRQSAVLLPLPAPGAIDGPRPPVGSATHGRGAELSARKLEGRVRGFANYSMAWARHRMGERTFDASENRRHVANIGVDADVLPRWRAGATFRYESGAPYTRITMVDGGCFGELGCSDPTVLWGTPSGQRAAAFTGLDLRTEWTLLFADWSLSIYGQLRNVLGSRNAVTYHSSCLCVDGSAGDTTLGDRFDRGLPRLPVLGLRARF